MKKIIVGTLIATSLITSIAPIPSVFAAQAKKTVSAAVVKPIPIPINLLNAKVTDEHLYHVFTGELLVSDSGASKQIAIVAGNQVVNAKYKFTREDGKEVWGFSLGFNRASLFVDNALTFAIRFKVNGKVYWDTNQQYKLTDEDNVLFGETKLKVEKSLFDWTFNAVNGSIITKRISSKDKVAIAYTTDNWLTRKIVWATPKEINKKTGLQRWDFSLPTTSDDTSVQYFVTLVAPSKNYVDNNGGIGYNIYR